MRQVFQILHHRSLTISILAAFFAVLATVFMPESWYRWQHLGMKYLLPAGIIAFLGLAEATARDAFNDSYPPQYRDEVTNLFPASLLNDRILLTAGLSGAYVLPKSTTEQQVGKNLLAVIQQAWRQQGIRFPKQFQIVLCHDLYFPRLTVVSTHAGLLFKEKTGYCYLEKMSFNGPFLRLDLHDKKQLNLFLADRCKGSTYTHHFVTFNDTEIEQLEVPK